MSYIFKKVMDWIQKLIVMEAMLGMLFDFKWTFNVREKLYPFVIYFPFLFT